MEFDRLVRLVGDLPVFESSLLLAGQAHPGQIQLQLSRWTAAGKILRLRRGLYALAPPYQKAVPHPFVVANQLVRASYVSAQSALAHHGLIPEAVPVTVSITGQRPSRHRTPLGRFVYHHLQAAHRRGYQRLEVSPGQWAFVATPAKALLDLVYLTPGGDAPAYLAELRLQNWDLLDLPELRREAERFASPKLLRAYTALAELAKADASEFAAP